MGSIRSGRAALIPCTKQQLEYQKNKNGMELYTSTSRDVLGCIVWERARLAQPKAAHAEALHVHTNMRRFSTRRCGLFNSKIHSSDTTHIS